MLFLRKGLVGYAKREANTANVYVIFCVKKRDIFDLNQLFVLYFLISINICRTFAGGIRKLIFKAQIITT